MCRCLQVYVQHIRYDNLLKTEPADRGLAGFLVLFDLLEGGEAGRNPLVERRTRPRLVRILRAGEARARSRWRDRRRLGLGRPRLGHGSGSEETNQDEEQGDERNEEEFCMLVGRCRCLQVYVQIRYDWGNMPV